MNGTKFWFYNSIQLYNKKSKYNNGKIMYYNIQSVLYFIKIKKSC